MSDSGFSGADWIVPALSLDGISDFGKKVADILGDMAFGIYHLDVRALRKVDWKNEGYISVVVYGGLATYDTDTLTRLIVLCHDRMVRLEVSAATWKHLRLEFWPRTSRDGELYTRHPTMETAIENIRGYYAPQREAAHAD